MSVNPFDSNGLQNQERSLEDGEPYDPVPLAVPDADPVPAGPYRDPRPVAPTGDPERDAQSGKFLPGNQIARDVGLYARQQIAPIKEYAERLKAGIVADLGGEDNLTTLERAYIDRLGDVEVTLQLIVADIANRGLISPSGRVRSIYDRLLGGIGTWDRLAQRLGLARRAKPTPSLAEIIEAHDRKASE